MSKRKSYKGQRFIQIFDFELDCPAYRHLSAYGRALLIEFRRLYYPGKNGKISMSVRYAAKCLNCNKDTAAKYIRELEDKGWIRLTDKGSFNHKTDKTASLWRITNQSVGLGVQTPPTKDYMKWRPDAKK